MNPHFHLVNSPVNGDQYLDIEIVENTLLEVDFDTMWSEKNP